MYSKYIYMYDNARSGLDGATFLGYICVFSLFYILLLLNIVNLYSLHYSRHQ